MTYFSRVAYPDLTGGGTAFAVPFPKLLQAHVKVYQIPQNGTFETDAILKVAGTHYNWTSEGEIAAVTAPTGHVTWDIRRETPKGEMLATITPTIAASSLNLDYTQLLYISQEALDEVTYQQTRSVRSQSDAQHTPTASDPSGSAGKFVVLDADGNFVYASSTGGADSALREDLADGATPGTSLVAAGPGKSLSAALISLAQGPIDGEVGVLDKWFPVGHPTRYGMSPDGTTDWEGDHASIMLAIYENMVNPRILVSFPPGPYATSMNLGADQSHGRCHFQPGSEFYGILHFVDSMDDFRASGLLCSYDRVGVIGTNVTLGHIRLKSDPDINTATPGADNRGVHILGGSNIRHGNVLVDKTGIAGAALPGTQQNWAGYAVQGPVRNVQGGNIWVKDAGGHGAYINCLDFESGLIRVDAYARGAIDFLTQLNDSDSAAQSEQASGVWLNRWSGHIRGIVVGQGNASPVNDTYSILFDETARNEVGTPRARSAVIDFAVASVGNGNRGVSIGEGTTAAEYQHYTIPGGIHVTPRATRTIATNYAQVNVIAPSNVITSRTILTTPHVTIETGGAQTQFQAKGAGAGTIVLEIGAIRSPAQAAAGRFILVDGTSGIIKGCIGSYVLKYAAGSPTDPLVDVVSCVGLQVGQGDIKAGGISGIGVRFKSNRDCRLEAEDITDCYSTLGGVVLDGNTRCHIGPIRSTNLASVGTGAGILIQGTHTACIFEGLNVTGFAKGFEDGTSPVFVDCAAIQCRATSNTDDTDFTTTDFPAADQLACLNFAI